MTTRVVTRTVTFKQPFVLDEFERPLPAGTYTVETEEETLDSASFVAYRRIATHIFVPMNPGTSTNMQMCAIHPNGLAAALSRDRDNAV